MMRMGVREIECYERNARHAYLANEAVKMIRLEGCLVLGKYYIFRHHLLHDPATQDPLLHGEPHHSLRRHILPHRARLLPSLGFGRKGKAK